MCREYLLGLLLVKSRVLVQRMAENRRSSSSDDMFS
jgi:hypothetical protein